jgi:replicative DNA helicase
MSQDASLDASALTVHDESAEKAVLGIMMLSPEATAEVRRRLDVDDFYSSRHQTIFTAACAIDDERLAVEPSSVLSRVVRDSTMAKNSSEIGIYLSEVYSEAPSAASLEYYAKLVRDAATRRGLAKIGVSMQQLAKLEGREDTTSIVEEMRSSLDDLAVDRIGSEVPIADEIIASTLDEIDILASGKNVPGIPTGFKDVDYALNGLRPGQMIVIAARPGVGKSSFMLDIVRHAAFKQKKSVLVFSLEMSKNEVMMRAISGEAYVDLQSLKTGTLDEHKWGQISKAAEKITGAKLGIDDNAAITITDIRAQARAFQRAHGLDLIAIDYLQLMNSDKRTDSRQQEVSEISRGVKLLAKEFNVPVLALSQLNRGSEQRTDKRPVISDLRESGAIEQDSDVVILLHREEMYEEESPRAGEADVVIAKQRSGPTGTVVLSWLGKFSRFDNRTISD